MKVSAINNILPKFSFQGFRHVKDNYGADELEFNFPFDDEEYRCYLEIYNVLKDENGNYQIIPKPVKNFNSDNNDGSLQLRYGANRINLKEDYLIDEDEPFAYHYKLLPKYGKVPIYRVEAGDVVDNTVRKNNGEICDKYAEIYNLVSDRKSKINRGGSMKLIIPDNFNVGYTYNPNLFDEHNILKNKEILQKAQKSFKHFSNKLGGTLAGVEKALDDGEFDGYSSIISLPIFTDDSRSAHGYWNKNCMQMIPTLGNINNYASLQRKMFSKGINFVSDGAFVNEGLEGIHFAHVLKWGEESPFFSWFKARGLNSDTFALGVFGNNHENTSHKIVNSPYKYEQDENGKIHIYRNKSYNPKKPTFIQIFDTRLVSDEQKNDTTNLINEYSVLNTSNPYEINTHDDTVINYAFEIDPETYNDNVLRLKQYNSSHDDKIFIDSFIGTKFLGQFEHFELENKIESNFNTWDANTDIAKLNYTYSHFDTEDKQSLRKKEAREFDKFLEEGNMQVKDYIINSGTYWTQKTKDILTLYVAQNLKDVNQYKPQEAIDLINKNIENNILPQKLLPEISDEVIKNVLDGKYKSNHKISKEPYKNQVKMGVMNFPLDSIEFGDNIAGVFATPYLTKRAIHQDEIGKTRYDMYKLNNPHLKPEYKNVYNNMQKLYEKELSGFALEILDMVQKQTDIPFQIGEKVTGFGSYVLPLLTSDITKFAIIKSLKPDTDIFINPKNGEIGYDYTALKQFSLQALGIQGASPKDEANQLVEKIRNGINSLTFNDKQNLANALALSIQGLNENSFALADMIVDRTGSGLDWRIDATKDIADIDALRNKKNSFGDSWQQIIDFWKQFTQEILDVNPNAYIVAEVTDEDELYNTGAGGNSKFKQDEIVKKFLNETNITATANYSHFFTDLAMMFGQNTQFNNGYMEYELDDYFQERIYQKFAGPEAYLRSSNLNSLLYSYTFIANHDKPRLLHCFALDMKQFFANLIGTSNFEYKERAYRIMHHNLNGYVDGNALLNENFDKISSKAMAMADTMITGFGDGLAKISGKNENFRRNNNLIYKSVMDSICDLATGNFLDTHFDPEIFGVKPFDVTIDAILLHAKEKYDLPLSEDEINLYKKTVFKIIVQPAYTKMLGAMKYLVALPGKPTLFSGDDLGATGYEEKTKNIYLQNRTYLHNEWKDENDFIRQCYNELNQVMSLRNRPELDALNNGTPYVLPIQKAKDGTKVSAILQQNTDGRMAISLFNTKGITHNPKEIYSPQSVELKEINLNGIDKDSNIGFRCGLHSGMEFANANNPDDKYKVFNFNGYYIIKHQDGSPISINDSTLILYHVPQDVRLYKYEYKPYSSDVANKYESNINS